MDVRIRRYAPSLFCLMMITVLSAIPGVTFKEPRYNFFGTDKIGHMGLYFLFTLSLFHSAGRKKADGSALLLALGASLGWGGLMELMQTLDIIGRSADWRDMLANLTGALLAFSLFALYLAVRNRKRAV